MIHWMNVHIHILSVIWLFPIVFMFHDFEEILTVEKWMKHNKKLIQSRFPTFLLKRFENRLNIDTFHFTKDVLWIFIVITASTILGVFLSFYYLFVLCLIIFFAHVFTHVGQTIYLKKYTPGVWTAIILVFPYSLYAFYRLFRGNLIEIHQLYWCIILLVVALPSLILFLIQRRR